MEVVVTEAADRGGGGCCFCCSNCQRMSKVCREIFLGVDCDGDYIRRVAGTVGTVSPLFKIKECLMH